MYSKNIKSIEIRLRNSAKNKGIFLSKSRTRNPDDVEFNTYKILKNDNIIKRGLTLKEAEEFILKYLP